MAAQIVTLSPTTGVAGLDTPTQAPGGDNTPPPTARTATVVPLPWLVAAPSFCLYLRVVSPLFKALFRHHRPRKRTTLSLFPTTLDARRPRSFAKRILVSFGSCINRASDNFSERKLDRGCSSNKKSDRPATRHLSNPALAHLLALLHHSRRQALRTV